VTVGVMRPGTIGIEIKGVDPPLCGWGGRHYEKRTGWIQGTLSSDLLHCKYATRHADWIEMLGLGEGVRCSEILYPLIFGLGQF